MGSSRPLTVVTLPDFEISSPSTNSGPDFVSTMTSQRPSGTSTDDLPDGSVVALNLIWLEPGSRKITETFCSIVPVDLSRTLRASLGNSNLDVRTGLKESLFTGDEIFFSSLPDLIAEGSIVFRSFSSGSSGTGKFVAVAGGIGPRSSAGGGISGNGMLGKLLLLCVSGNLGRFSTGGKSLALPFSTTGGFSFGPVDLPEVGLSSGLGIDSAGERGGTEGSDLGSSAAGGGTSDSGLSLRDFGSSTAGGSGESTGLSAGFSGGSVGAELSLPDGFGNAVPGAFTSGARGGEDSEAFSAAFGGEADPLFLVVVLTSVSGLFEAPGLSRLGSLGLETTCGFSAGSDDFSLSVAGKSCNSGTRVGSRAGLTVL